MALSLLADMLTRIRNASFVQHQWTNVINTKLNLNILKILKKEGYILDYKLIKENKSLLLVYLQYRGWWQKKATFSTLRLVSKPGQRVFSTYRNFLKKENLLKYNQGILIISTSHGVMSHWKAIKLKIGGEILCYVG